MEHFQGEGGYRIASEKMVKDVFSICKKYEIPYIADEVQSGMGRTGKFWSFEHYGIKPDVFSAAKALQVGAVVSSKRNFPSEAGAISSTWGGGSRIDLALGIKTIEIIKKKKLLQKNRINGEYLQKELREIGAENVRGKGLMIGFDLENESQRDNLIIEFTVYKLEVETNTEIVTSDDEFKNYMWISPKTLAKRSDLRQGLHDVLETIYKIT